MPQSSLAHALRQIAEARHHDPFAVLGRHHAEGDAVVVRADEGIDYGRVVDLLDHFRSAGISRFGLAADAGGK